jgi:endo-1,4-beta-xylanase
MKSKPWLLINLILVLSGVWNFSCYAQLPSEQPLWPKGIAGFSAGGSLSLRVALGVHKSELPSYAVFNNLNTKPDFAGLFYPGLDSDMINLAGKKDVFPPVFIMNGGEDTTTPAGNCIELYKVLTSRHFSTELHIYAKGGHGFDSGLERGYAISTWRDSFIAWLKDTGLIKE